MAMVFKFGGTTLPPQPTGISAGTITVGTTPVQGPNVAVARGREVSLFCPETNSASVFVGDANVSPTNGVEIEPGGGLLIAVDNLNRLWFVSTAANQVVRYVAEKL